MRLDQKDALINFGRRLKAIRETANISQDQMSYATGITQPHISKIESGALNVGLRHISILAAFFGLDDFEMLQYRSTIPDSDDLRKNVAKFIKTKRIDPTVFLKKGLTHLLTSIVLSSRFFISPRYVKEIVTHLDEKFEAKFTTTAVSQAMQTLREKGLIDQLITDKKSKFQYKKRVVPIL